MIHKVHLIFSPGSAIMSSWIIMRASILLMLSMCYCGLVMFGVSVSKHFFQEKVINTSWDGSSVAPPCFAVGLMGREFLLQWILFSICFVPGDCYGTHHCSNAPDCHENFNCCPNGYLLFLVAVIGILVLWMFFEVKKYCIHILQYHEHHGYEVIPSFLCVTKACISMQHAHRKKVFLGDELAVLVDGRYILAVLVNVIVVKQDLWHRAIIMTPAFMSAQKDNYLISPSPVANHPLLLEDESSRNTEFFCWSAAEMYDGQYCRVAPVDFVGCAPATHLEITEGIYRSLEPQIVEPEQRGNCPIT